MKRIEILKHNLRIINLLNKIITYILFGLLCIHFIFEYFIQHSTDIFDLIQFDYIAVILFNLVVHYVMNIRKINVTKEKIKSLELLLGIYVTILIILGVFISLRETSNYNPLLVYTFIQLICSSFLVLSFYQILIPILLSVSILFIGLITSNGFNEVIYMQGIYVLSIASISFLLAYYRRKNFEISIQYQLDLTVEAKNNRELSKKLREVNRKLELQLLHDPLTDLFNRRAYNDYVKDLQRRIKEAPQNVSVIMLDVDFFKQYNDTYGHFEGDNVLIQIAKKLQEIGEGFNCFVARWGGEEFSLLVVNQTTSLTDRICERIIEKVNDLKIEHSTSQAAQYVTVSIGANTRFAKEPKDIVDCINLADEMLYNVKQNGRNHYYHNNEVKSETSN